MTRTRPAEDEPQYGFRWGQVDVHRYISLEDGRKALGILTDHTSIEVYISPAGRKIRVYQDGRELK